MKISDIGKTRQASSLKKKKKVSEVDSDAFSSLINESDSSESAKSSTIGSASPMGSIIDAQMFESTQEEIEKEVERGEDILDLLNQLRMDLLSGSLSEQGIQRLIELVRGKKAQAVGDPMLSEIINDIEIRAEVELAKLRR